MDTLTLQEPIYVDAQPASIAMSPDGHYLIVGYYAASPGPGAFPALGIVDLNWPHQQRSLSLGTASVLTVAFPNGPNALVVLTGPASQDKSVRLLDPVTATLTTLTLLDATSTPLQVPWATFPAEIIQGSAGVSGDGNVVYAMVSAGTAAASVVQYTVTTNTLTLAGVTSTPALGPRVVSVDEAGTTLLAGWALLDSSLRDLAQFPYAPGILNHGGHTFDWSRKLIYAQVAAGTIQAPSPGVAPLPLLHILDSDNLTVRETFQLRENLAGKALLSGDNMYAISDSGLTVLPTRALSGVHRVKGVQEDLMFQASGCNQGAVSQFLDIADPSGGATDFTLTTTSPGIRFSSASGKTPARVQIFVDPTVFQDKKGTATVWVQIASEQAVNVPTPVRLLISTRDPDQQGAVFNVPGTIVDVLADPARDRFYVIRQDKNQVLVFDGTSFTQIGEPLRTGNTPVQMAMYQNYLLVTNDNSQLVNMYDLNTLKPADPIFFPGGYYPRSIAVSTGALRTDILVTARAAGGPNVIMNINCFGFFSSPCSVSPVGTGVYKNDIDVNSALVASPSGRTIFMVMPTGTVALYENQARTFVASRKDSNVQAPLSGAYAAMSDELFMAGNYVFNSALVPLGQIDLLGGISSGSTMLGDRAIISSAPTTARSGVIQHYSLDPLTTISPVRMVEAPGLAANLKTTPVGQIGQTILPFTRTLAPMVSRQFIVQLSTSGFTTIPWAFGAGFQPPVITAVTNAADQTSPVAPGGLISIWGKGLSGGNTSATQVPLPKGLGDVCLYSNSLALPLLFVSPNQINAQLPFNATANTSIAISSSSGQSAPFSFPVQPTAPAVFRTGNGGPMIIRTVDGKYITDSTPIHLDQTLIIYMTGMGPVGPTVSTGDAAPATPLSTTNIKPAITIGGADIWTLWSGLAPGLVGVYQINAQVPFHHIPTGRNIPFTIKQGGASTTVYLRVEE